MKWDIIICLHFYIMNLFQLSQLSVVLNVSLICFIWPLALTMSSAVRPYWRRVLDASYGRAPPRHSAMIQFVIGVPTTQAFAEIALAAVSLVVAVIAVDHKVAHPLNGYSLVAAVKPLCWGRCREKSWNRALWEDVSVYETSPTPTLNQWKSYQWTVCPFTFNHTGSVQQLASYSQIVTYFLTPLCSC